MSEGARRDRVRALIETLSSDGGRPVHADRTLAEVGLDSLGWAEVVSAVEAELGVDLSSLDVGPGTRLREVLGAVQQGDGDRIRRPRTGRLQGPAAFLGGAALRWWFRVRVLGAP